MESQSAISLATSLTEREEGNRVRRVKPNGLYRPTKKSCIVNWGNSSEPEWNYTNSRLLNKPSAVQIACNKLSALTKLSSYDEVNLPDFTDDKEVALEWASEGTTVVCRTLLNAHSGAGIVIASREEDVIDAKLYTKYIKKKKEFRVHVFNGKIIDIQQKKVRNGIDVPNYAVRNYANGWVFCREDLEYSEQLLDQAILAVKYIGLDFGAVDIVYNQHHNTYYVLEVNSAPGLEGTTLQTYVENIHEYFLD
jgi:glutathione synthase/RimK-type ligase-like ATP-grasp enzyme